MNLLSDIEFPVHSFVDLSHAVCAEAFNPDEDEEDKEPWVNYVSYSKVPVLILRLICPNSMSCSFESNCEHYSLMCVL